MGCPCSTVNVSNEYFDLGLDGYNWDPGQVIVANLTIQNLVAQEEIRLPGTVNGQQFIIENCQDSTMYVLDFINTVTIDGCSNCKIILGPVEGSVFIRNCTSCTCAVACGQFRVRDSTKINAFLFSATQPIIEASSGIQFGSYNLNYNDIQDHFEKTKLNCKIKNWKFIYDFTPLGCEQNWSFMKNNDISQYVPEPESESVKNELIKLGYSWSCKDNPESENDKKNKKEIEVENEIEEDKEEKENKNKNAKENKTEYEYEKESKKEIEDEKGKENVSKNEKGKENVNKNEKGKEIINKNEKGKENINKNAKENKTEYEYEKESKKEIEDEKGKENINKNEKGNIS